MISANLPGKSLYAEISHNSPKCGNCTARAGTFCCRKLKKVITYYNIKTNKLWQFAHDNRTITLQGSILWNLLKQLLLIRCGDIEQNPGPGQTTIPKALCAHPTCTNKRNLLNTLPLRCIACLNYYHKKPQCSGIKKNEKFPALWTCRQCTSGNPTPPAAPTNAPVPSPQASKNAVTKQITCYKHKLLQPFPRCSGKIRSDSRYLTCSSIGCNNACHQKCTDQLSRYAAFRNTALWYSTSLNLIRA